MSRDLKHQSLEHTFKKVAELEFENDEDNIKNSIFPNDNDRYNDSGSDNSDSDDSSSEGSVDLGLADDLKESDSAMQCVLELEDVVNDLLGVKDRLLALYPLPTEVQLHLVIPLTKLTLLKNTLKPSVRHLQKIAKIFASGELSDEMVKHMRTVLAAAQAELGMERKRRVELERKINTLTFQSDHQHRQVQLIRWLKLFSSLRRREILNANKHKVKHLQHVVASLRRKFHRTQDKVDDLERELQITKVEAEAMVKQAHQSRKLAAQAAEEANNIGQHAMLSSKINENRPPSHISNRPSTANTVASSIDESYTGSQVDLNSVDEEITKEITYDPNDNPPSHVRASNAILNEMTEEEKLAKKEAKRKALQLQKEFDIQFEKAMLEVRSNHHDGENGIKDLDARAAFEIYKKAAEEKEDKMHEEEMKEKAAKEPSWHKRYFKHHSKEVDDNDNAPKNTSDKQIHQGVENIETNKHVNNPTENNNDHTTSSTTTTIGHKGARNNNVNELGNNNSNNGSNVNDSKVFGMKKDENYSNEAYTLVLQQNRDTIDRLEMMVRGLEAQMRLKDHTIEQLRAKNDLISIEVKKSGRHLKQGRNLVHSNNANTNPERYNYNDDLNYEGNSRRMIGSDAGYNNNNMFSQHDNSLRPWTATTVVRRNSKTNTMELPAKFIPMRMPPNQPYKQKRFKTKLFYKPNSTVSNKNRPNMNLSSVNFTDRIMQARRPTSQRTQRSRSYY
jgi:hypothetical protein